MATLSSLLKTALASALLLSSVSAPCGADMPEDNIPGQKKITILQVNDVYQEEPVDNGTRGGLARVATLKREIVTKQPNTLFLLAGDTLSPSLASRTFKGAQMIACWNALGIDVACFGNHEFDFGPEVFKERIRESKFPWICANTIDKATGKLWAGVSPYIIKNVGGVKVGIIGLLTPDTVRTSHTGPGIDVTDPCEAAKKYLPEMKKAGAEVIVALTHLTMAGDKEVAACVPIDLIIGGHEHVILQSVVNGIPIVKSGSDARFLGRTDINYDPAAQKVASIDWDLLPVTNKIKTDVEVDRLVKQFENQLSKELDQPVGETKVELDGRQAANQTQETNLGNFITDAYRQETRADVAIINGGSIRSNSMYGPGRLTRRDLLSMLPFENPVVKMEVRGSTVRAALENGVSLVGLKSGGRFPQVSGLSFVYDATKPPGSRVANITVNGRALSDSATYTLATNNFAAEGGDGYDMFKGQKMLIDAEAGSTESVIFLDAVSKAKTIAPRTEGRIKRVDKTQ